MAVAYMCQDPGAVQNNRNVCWVIIETTTGSRKILIPTATSSKEVGASVIIRIFGNPGSGYCVFMENNAIVFGFRFASIFENSDDEIGAVLDIAEEINIHGRAGY